MNQITMPVLPEMNELWQETLNWQPDESQQQQFQRLYELIVEGNRSLNLTRITEPIEFWEKHLWDSLRGIARLLPANNSAGENRELPAESVQKVIDIGTGGGFRVCRSRSPCRNYQLLCSILLAKKLLFWKQLCRLLG